ncbi:MAG: hypothetical protein ABI268_05730 [Rhodanobacter sp.]
MKWIFPSQSFDNLACIFPSSRATVHASKKKRNIMGINDHKTGSNAGNQKGGIGYVLMWFLGVPIPLLILFALLRGCA